MHDPDARYIRHIEVFSAENERMLRKSLRKRTATTTVQDSNDLPARVRCQVVHAYGWFLIVLYMKCVRKSTYARECVRKCRGILSWFPLHVHLRPLRTRHTHLI